MTVDILLTLLNVVWGVILTGIGIEMVNNPPDTAGRKRLYRVLFCMFGFAVIATTFFQSVRSSGEQEQARIEADRKERELSEKVSKSDGKLDAIAHFEQQFLTFVSSQSSQRPGTPDAAAKAYEAMAMSVLKLAQSSGTPAPSEARLQILSENAELDGRTIVVPANQSAPFINFPDFRFKNVGGRATGPVSARLYFSKPLNLTAIGFGWQPTASDEPKYPYAFYGAVGPVQVVINPQETWNWPGFAAQATQAVNEPILGKLKVFYGALKPAEAHFTFRKQEGS